MDITRFNRRDKRSTSISRREWLAAAGVCGAVAVTSPSTISAETDTPSDGQTPLLKPVFESVVCRWTPENPRHDHQLIFPLSDDRLMLAWCEYYADRPSLTFRQPTSRGGQASDDMPCRISARVSRDQGRTWDARFTLQDNLWKLNVKHPNLVRLDSGEILFFFVGWDSAGQRNTFLKRSSDQCESWTAVKQISEPGWYCNNNDHALRLRSGRILLPAHGVLGGGPYRGGKSKLESFVWFSDDGFQTWRRSAEGMTTEGRGCHEPSIVELKDGRLLCLLRTTRGCVYKSYSEDGGDHWSTPAATPLDAPDSPPLVKRTPGGNLLALWNNIASRSNWPRTPLTAAVSRDEGESWKSFHDIDNRPRHDAAYASVLFHGDETLIAYYTRSTSWARDSEVTLKIFKTEQFDA
ncbi:MAG: sialidase family protein [Pirellulaceae bacterium]